MEWEGQAEEPPCEGRLAGGVICEGPRDGVEPDRRGRLDFQHIHAKAKYNPDANFATGWPTLQRVYYVYLYDVYYRSLTNWANDET